MQTPTCFEIHDGVGVITIDNPPVNALSRGVPQAVARAVLEAQTNPDVRALVVLGAGRTFVAGADIHEFVKAVAGSGPMPELHASLDAIEMSEKPVVMAIHGQALGAGLELAMAGHFRIATADAQVGQPEVKIGLIPGAGGTVRLPRLAGLKKAAEMCAFGEPISAQEAFAAGIIDRVVEADLRARAIEFAQGLTSIRRTRDLKISGDIGELQEIRERCHRTRRHIEAPLVALASIENAAGTSFEEGCRVEGSLFERRLYSLQAKALIHAFFAERAAAKVPGIEKDTPALPIREAGVIGAGTMGSGIAMALANAGIHVRLKDTDAAAVERGIAAIVKNFQRSVKSGRLTAEAVAERMARITPQVDYTGFGQADIIIEAVFESLALKKSVFAEMDAVANAECLLATNTSTLDVDELAQATSRPQMVIGTHFFSPANIMRLLEIVRGSQTSKPAIATAMALAKAMKKVGVVVGNGFGFVGNRMLIPYMNEAQFLVEEGATPEQVDRVLTDFGMAMGPLAVADLSGLDVFWRIRQEAPHAPGARLPLGLPKLYALGRYGQKTGAGWFQYGADRKAVGDPAVTEIVWAAAREAGIAQRAISDTEILDRCVYALVNEGAQVLEEGIAARAVDIDVVYLTGYGFPAHRGGPMFYADTVGLARVLDRVREFGWKPAALLERLAAEGGRFSSE
ncbi:MAG: 3-hydroxyacyl-CoA dehydrogenase NAD-binding domain-containing protein [Acidobacteriota bacterium]